MTTKEYLSQLYELRKIIESNINELNELIELSITISSLKYKKDKIQENKDNTAKFEEVIAEICDLENLTYCYLICSIKLQKEIVDLINKIPDQKEKYLLILKHIKFKSWSDICEELDVSDRTGRRIYNKAIKNIEKLTEIGR